MSFLKIEGLGDAKEPQLLPECKTTLVVADVHSYQSDKNGRTICRIRHDVQDERFDEANNIMHWLSFPMEEDEPETVKLLVRGLKRYLVMAGITFEAEGFNEEDLYGATFEAQILQEESEESGEIFNKIKLPRLAQDE